MSQTRGVVIDQWTLREQFHNLAERVLRSIEAKDTSLHKLSYGPELARATFTLAELIKEKGTVDVIPSLVRVAQEIGKLGTDFNEVSEMAKAVRRALDAAPLENPFAGMNLTHEGQ